jgi:LysR family transcriptional activator of mexEF-oprN operon
LPVTRRPRAASNGRREVRAVTPLNHFNLRSFDLNLLVAFDALMQERNVTRAATRLRIQQPAMSHSLSALRMLLDDELFVRVGNVMQPTPKAESLATHVAHILEQTQRVIEASEHFAAETAERTFRIGFSCDEVVLLPLLGQALEAAGPGLKVVAQRLSSDTIMGELDQGSIDLAVGCYVDMPTRFRTRELFRQVLACCFHPCFLGSEPLDRERYLAARHVTVFPASGLDGCYSQTLRSSGCELNTVIAVPDYITALATAAASPLVVSLPRHVADRFAASFGLTVCAAPVDVALQPISMMWAVRNDKEPAAKWLRREVMAAADKLA